MNELVVISGKGGTGKTSIVASLAALADGKVLADCDVDAADLHLVLEPTIRHREPFSGGKCAEIVTDECVACGKCMELCRFGAVRDDGPGNGGVERTFRVDPIACEGCGVCVHFCPAEAIRFEPRVNGEWFISDTRHGPMVHARLGIAEENSGKLVTVVRNQAKEIAKQQGLALILVDGSPGIGCPVIASIAGASLVLAVTEPTLSGEHDLARVVELAGHFHAPVAVCINKCDLNTEMAGRIADWCAQHDVPVVGWIPYDRGFTEAQVNRLSLVEYADGPSATKLRHMWDKIQDLLST